MAENPVAAATDGASSAASSAGSGAAKFLRAKTFGMPRWAWMGLLAGGIAVGLYLRQRQVAAEEEMMDADADALAFPDEDTLAGYSDEPGLAGVGVAGPAGGSVIPVTSPVLPEGLGELITSVTDNLGLVSEALADNLPAAQGQPAPPTVIVNPTPPPVAPPTGGGPPERPANAHRPKRYLTGSEYESILRGLDKKQAQRFRQLTAKGEGKSRVIGNVSAWEKFVKSLPKKQRQAARKKADALPPKPHR